MPDIRTFYETYQDANMYLSGSIILDGEEPVIVNEVEQNFMANIIPIAANHGYVKDLKGGDFNINPIPLGYLNRDDNSYYISRLPKRSWRQGLSRNNILTDLPWQRMLCEGFVDMAKNIYPSFKQSLGKVDSGDVKRCAFNRKFCLELNQRTGNISVCYKTRSVGDVIDGVIQLRNQYGYLHELLMEAL